MLDVGYDLGVLVLEFLLFLLDPLPDLLFLLDLLELFLPEALLLSPTEFSLWLFLFLFLGLLLVDLDLEWLLELLELSLCRAETSSAHLEQLGTRLQTRFRWWRDSAIY